MGTVMTIKDADFSGLASLSDIPVLGNLEAWHYLGGDVAQSVRNYAPGKADATIEAPVGKTPVFLRNYAQFQASFGNLLTSVSETNEMTLIAVGRAGGTSWQGPSYISNYFGTAAPGDRGFSLEVDAQGAFASAHQILSGTISSVLARDGAATADQDQAKLTNWCFYAARVTTTYVYYDEKYGAGLKVPWALAAGASRQLGTRPYRIGARASGSRPNPAHMAFAAIYSRSISDLELNTIYQRVKAIMARRSIVI